jgi:methionyl-tRNA synthetase
MSNIELGDLILRLNETFGVGEHLGSDNKISPLSFAPEFSPFNLKKKYISTTIKNNPNINEIILTDIIARYYRLLNYEVFFLTGINEFNYSKNKKDIVKHSGSENIWGRRFSSQSFTSSNLLNESKNNNFKKLLENLSISKESKINKYNEILQKLFISNNDFIYMSLEKHINIVRQLYFIIKQKGDIYEKNNNYYFKLSIYKNNIIEWLSNNIITYPLYYQSLILKKLTSKDYILNDICIGINKKNINEGILLPDNNNYYLLPWFYELISYISANIYEYPVNINIINKNDLWYNIVVLGGILLSTKLKLPEKIYINSRNNILNEDKNIIIPNNILKKYPISSIRYYILREYKYKNYNFIWDNTKIKNYHNNELIHKFGNLVSRTISLVIKFNNNKIPTEDCIELFSIKDLVNNIENNLNKFRLDLIIKDIFNKIKLFNKLITFSTPWVSINKDKNKIVIKTVLDGIYILSNLLFPIIPDIIEKIFILLKTPPVKSYNDLNWNILNGNLKINKNIKLFNKII